MNTLKPLTDPLTHAELDLLDNFLLERIDDDADTEGKDEGILDISELDGFFTALVSGPASVMPSRWLPALWGDFPPTWETMKDFEDIVSLLMRHMNGIVDLLMYQPDEFEPLFLERVVDGKTYTIVDEWCEGYMQGVALSADQWNTAGAEMTTLLAPIRAFTSETDWQAHALSSDEETDHVRDAITPNARAIHAWWLARRENYMPAPSPAQRASTQVGRNDPCPCGSGKKYKRCCLH